MADKEVEDINDLAAYSSDEEGEPEAEVETKPESEIKKCVPLPFLFSFPSLNFYDLKLNF